MDTSQPQIPPSSDKQLSGNLGTASICFMVIAASAPLTVVGGPMTLGFVFGNGATLPSVYVVTGLVLICFAAAFTAMTPYVKSAGAFYSYIHKGLGRRVGIAAGYTALITYGALYLGVYALFGTGLRSLVESFGGPSIPWWLCAIAGLLLVGFLGYRNIEISGRILAVLLVAEITIVIILDAVIFSRQSGVAAMPTEFLNPLEVFSSSAGNAFIFTVLSFIGIEATAVFRSETKNPEKTVPRALYISLFCVAIFYGLTSWSLVYATGETSITEVTSADPEGYLPAVSLQYLGTVGQHIVAVLFVTSILAAAITFHNVVARYLFTLGSEMLMPGGLATTHPKHGSPANASTWTTGSVAVGLLLTIVLRLDPMAEMYTWTAGLASLGYVWLLLGTSVAVVVFLLSVLRRGGHVRRWPVIAAFVSSLGLLVIFWLMLTNLGLLVGESAGVAWVILSLLVLPLFIGPMTGKLKPDAAKGETSTPLPESTNGDSSSLPERDTT